MPPLLLLMLVASPQEPVTGGEARLAAWERRREMAAGSPFAGREWRALGPKFCGGRIEAVDCPPDRPGVIYAGVGAGGVWKSENGGLSWEAIFADQATFAIGDVEVSRADPGIVWVGTGEAHLSGTSYEGLGVYRSTDAGETWTNVGLNESAHVGKVVAHPADRERVWVAAIGPRHDPGGERGVYRTHDGGGTWEQVLHAGPGVALIDLVLDPNDPERLLAASWDRAHGEASGVHRSTDGGETWEKLGGGLLEEKVGRVAVDASASEPGVAYALMVDHSPPGGGRDGVGGVLFRSDDGGDTWRRTHEGYLSTYVGWDFCDVRVSPDDADEVYVCGLRLLVSRDGGETFERGGEAVQRLHPHHGLGMHLDMHDVWIDPVHPDRVLLGTDGGLYVSWDRARSWLHLNNLPIAEFYRVHVTRGEIWGGTQDNASLVAPIDVALKAWRRDRWEHVWLDVWSGGDGFATFPDPNDPTIVYYAQQVGDLKRQVRGELRRAKRITPRGQGFGFAWDTPYLASRHTEGRIYCASQQVHRSDDRGDTWERIGPEASQRSLLAVAESPLDGARLFAAGGRGEAWVTADGGEAWTPVGGDTLTGTARDAVASEHDEERLLVAFSRAKQGDWRSYLHRSDDFGATWTDLGAGLPHEPVNAIAEDPTNEAVLYAGTDLGVFATLDGGATWSPLGSGLPTAPVLDLAVDAETSTLVAVTHGLSAFAVDVAGIGD